jgi:hypothetical protein
MKYLSTCIGIILPIFFQACSGKSPIREDILGAWMSSDGAVLVFNKDGTFVGDSIPSRFGFTSFDSITQHKFSGSGKWSLRKGQARWEVYLDFNQVTVRKNGCAFPVLIAGKDGVLENEPPWYLFLWEGEEGGQTYEFKRK